MVGAIAAAATASNNRRRFGIPTLGVRGSLFTAFAVIAGMAMLISVGSGTSLSKLGAAMTELSGRDIPKLAASLQLTTQSESLASQAPMLLASSSAEALRERQQRMRVALEVATQRLADITRYGADPAVIAAMTDTLKNIEDTIRSLGAAAQERLDLAASHQKLYHTLRSAQDEFLALATPAMMDAQTRMSAALASTSLNASDAADAGRTIELLGNVIAPSNLIVSNLMAALSARDVEVLAALEASFTDADATVRSSLEALPAEGGTAALKEAALRLIALGDGKTGIFKIRQKELDAIAYGELILDETRKLNLGLGVSVKQLVDSVRVDTEAAAKQAHREIALATQVMIGLGGLILIGSALYVWLYVGRSILRRMHKLQRAMQALSAGQLDTTIDRGGRQDELAAMAATLEVFRENMMHARELSEAQEQDRIAKAERTARIEARIAEFESKVRGALEKLEASASAMQDTAQGMSASADRSNTLVNTVASAAEQTSVNVQTVAVGTEQLSSSIAEIGRQVVSSAAIATKAVSEASATDATIQSLNDNAGRISAVIDLIQSIASQTNLLALNATIEAARAGEAGRGFAVVAAEVKALAEQTAKATDEIRLQIAAMQEVTGSAVGAIRNIGQTIGAINSVTTAITAAVEQQSAATQEMARNIQHAAGGTSRVSGNIAGVSEASAQAGSAAGEVLAASSSLRREADILRGEIDDFLLNIRAA
ncbi:methyl-accepting chemotaxis protein [Rhodopseudomonas faecalis]|uniref:Methyl-accepting chemotaxis protein n=1 Tax=Rhodopseudomonas faecalis TaxID=99655 RepID=A0A318TE23_9BRAD|nr:methyl-accepting chemotaxis protein [Rhodopseudomonas faecalis]PYF02984.1 methyl-accepting chemotaxis protein [Rhodopseudomonas faecalis]